MLFPGTTCPEKRIYLGSAALAMVFFLLGKHVLKKKNYVTEFSVPSKCFLGQKDALKQPMCLASAFLANLLSSRKSADFKIS